MSACCRGNQNCVRGWRGGLRRFHLIDDLFFRSSWYCRLPGADRPALLVDHALSGTAAMCFAVGKLDVDCCRKFSYFQYTMAVLIAHPSITAGFPPQVVIVIASFVEFTLAFLISAGRGLLGS